MNSIRFLYFTDTLCGWCFGMSPVIERIIDEVAPRFPFEMHHYGLCPGERALAVTPDLLDGFRAEVARIERLTGAAFSQSFWDLLAKKGFRYDCLPATRAALAVRAIDPTREMAFVHDMQRRLFAGGEDPRDNATFAAAAKEVGVDAERVLELCQTLEITEKTEEDFDLADDLDIEIAPSLLLIANDEITRLCAGFTPYEDLKARIDTALETVKLARISGF